MQKLSGVGPGAKGKDGKRRVKEWHENNLCKFITNKQSFYYKSFLGRDERIRRESKITLGRKNKAEKSSKAF
jgi:hypothetical protein